MGKVLRDMSLMQANGIRVDGYHSQHGQNGPKGLKAMFLGTYFNGKESEANVIEFDLKNEKLILVSK